MDWPQEVQLSSLVLESHEVQSQAHISLTPSSSSPPSGPPLVVVVWELEEDSSRFSIQQSFPLLILFMAPLAFPFSTSISIYISILILLIPVELVWLVFGEQKKLTKTTKFLQCWVTFLIWCPLGILTNCPVVCLLVNKLMLTLDSCTTPL